MMSRSRSSGGTVLWTSDSRGARPPPAAAPISLSSRTSAGRNGTFADPAHGGGLIALKGQPARRSAARRACRPERSARPGCGADPGCRCPIARRRRRRWTRGCNGTHQQVGRADVGELDRVDGADPGDGRAGAVVEAIDPRFADTAICPVRPGRPPARRGRAGILRRLGRLRTTGAGSAVRLRRVISIVSPRTKAGQPVFLQLGFLHQPVREAPEQFAVGPAAFDSRAPRARYGR